MNAHWGQHDHTVLVLQGGGALGAYQAGVYEGLAECADVRASIANPQWHRATDGAEGMRVYDMLPKDTHATAR